MTMETVNQKNKKIWDDIFSKQPEIDGDVLEYDNETGEYKPAVPVGFDGEQKTYDAVKEIIESAIKNKNYKTYKIGSPAVDTYGDKSPILPYDVIFPFTSDWETPLYFVMVKEITEDGIIVMSLGKEYSDVVISSRLSFYKSPFK